MAPDGDKDDGSNPAAVLGKFILIPESGFVIIMAMLFAGSIDEIGKEACVVSPFMQASR